MVKKIIFISVVAVLLVFGGLTIYVANMDWNAHKHEIAARFSSTFGKKIDFGGNISVSLWPKPHHFPSFLSEKENCCGNKSIKR